MEIEFDGVHLAVAAGVAALRDHEKNQRHQEQDAARALIARGWLSIVTLPAATGTAPASAPLPVSPGPDPNEEQRLAIDKVCDSLGGFAGFVLHGVTGSG